MSERPKKRKNWIEGSTLGIGVVLVAALLAFVNYFGWKYHHRADWTSTRLYSLSEKSLDVLASLDRDVEVVVFVRQGDELYGPVRELLQRYDAASPRLSLRFVDPDRNLLEAQQLVDRYEVQNLNVVIFDTGDDRRVVEARDLAEYDFSGYQYGEGPEMKGFLGEERFTSALVELMDERKPKVLFTQGHGEVDPDDTSAQGFSEARALLGKDNFEIDSWTSLGAEGVPAGTDLVVVAGPTEPFLEPEVELLARYLDGGGRLLLLLDPTLTQGGSLVALGLGSWLTPLGVEVGDDLVIDPDNILPFFGAETFFADRYGSHEITEALDQLRTPIIVPLARSVSLGETPSTVDAVSLVETHEGGWGETNLADLAGLDKDDDDRQGPVSLAVALAWPENDEATGSSAGASSGEEGGEGEEEATRSEEEGPRAARLVVVGDSDFAANAQVARPGNALFLSNTFNWLVERQTLLGIPPKTPQQVRLGLTGDQLVGIYLLSLILLPGLAVAAGVWVHLRRRR